MTVAAWTATLGSWTAGPAEDVVVGDQNGNGPTGFVGIGARNSDQARGNLPGSVSGRDVPDAGTGSVPLFVNSTPSGVWDIWETLRGAWQPKGTGEVALVLGDPRGVQRTWFGRPDGLSAEDESMIGDGLVACIARFRVLDPFSYADPVEVDTAGTIVVGGFAETDRITVTVHGTGGIPSIVNPATDTVLTWSGALASGQTRTIDCRARTVTNGGVSALGELTPYLEWLTLAPGSNALTVTGCTIDVTFLAAYP